MDWEKGRSSWRNPSAFLTIATALLVACGPPQLNDPPDPTPRDAAVSMDGDISFPDTGIGRRDLELTRLAPNHGPFTGGNEVLVRGGGFTDTTFVTVGGRMVQPADLQFVDANRLLITAMPAGEPGSVDVVVQDGEAGAQVEDAYTYDAIALDPVRGSVSGGTVVTLTGSGTAFEDSDQVFFGDAECTDVEVVSSGVMRCTTPPGAPGSADVRYAPRDGSVTTIPDGFEYYDASDPTSGGLGGGPLEGTLNVAVIDALTGLPVSDAFVVVDTLTPEAHQGLTNITGQITFSGDDLVGQHVVHAAKHCYEKTSWVAFDAQDVTIFLVPWMDLRCGMGGGGGGGSGRSGAYVSGELVWRDGVEFEVPRPVEWKNVPEPRNDDWVRAAYVHATQRCAGDSASCTNPSPDAGGGQSRVLELNRGERGYTYRIFVRPAAFAVYALAGLENIRTGEFVPYVMGIARNVLAGPGQEIRQINMDMNIPLDHYLDVRVDGLPDGTPSGPDRFEVAADIDLGGEGLIVRRTQGERIDLLDGRSAERPFRFFAQPAIFGALADGRYRVEARWLTGDFGADPSTTSRRVGIREVDQEVRVDGFAPIPVATAPAFGQTLPEDRMLRWDAEGGSDPDFFFVRMTGGDGNPAWRYFVRGDQREAPIPDLSEIEGIDDVAPGFLSLEVFAVRIPGFDFDRMTYRDLSSTRWNAWGVNSFTARQ